MPSWLYVQSKCCLVCDHSHQPSLILHEPPQVQEPSLWQKLWCSCASGCEALLSVPDTQPSISAAAATNSAAAPAVKQISSSLTAVRQQLHLLATGASMGTGLMQAIVKLLLLLTMDDTSPTVQQTTASTNYIAMPPQYADGAASDVPGQPGCVGPSAAAVALQCYQQHVVSALQLLNALLMYDDSCIQVAAVLAGAIVPDWQVHNKPQGGNSSSSSVFVVAGSTRAKWCRRAAAGCSHSAGSGGVSGNQPDSQDTGTSGTGPQQRKHDRTFVALLLTIAEKTDNWLTSVAQVLATLAGRFPASARHVLLPVVESGLLSQLVHHGSRQCRHAGLMVLLSMLSSKGVQDALALATTSAAAASPAQSTKEGADVDMLDAKGNAGSARQSGAALTASTVQHIWLGLLDCLSASIDNRPQPHGPHAGSLKGSGHIHQHPHNACAIRPGRGSHSISTSAAWGSFQDHRLALAVFALLLDTQQYAILLPIFTEESCAGMAGVLAGVVRAVWCAVCSS